MTKEEAITRLKNMAWLYGSVEREQNLEAIDMAVEALEKEPKTGKWIIHIDDLFPEESTMECNQCHKHQPLTIDDNYCPNCGVKMNGGKNE